MKQLVDTCSKCLYVTAYICMYARCNGPRCGRDFYTL